MLFNYKDFPVNRSLIKRVTIPKRLNYLLNLVYRSKLLQFTLLFSDHPFQFRCAERRERNSNTNDTNNLMEKLRRSKFEANSSSRFDSEPICLSLNPPRQDTYEIVNTKSTICRKICATTDNTISCNRRWPAYVDLLVAGVRR